MYKPSKKTIYLTGAFAAVAGLVGVYSYWNDISYILNNFHQPWCHRIYYEALDRAPALPNPDFCPIDDAFLLLLRS